MSHYKAFVWLVAIAWFQETKIGNQNAYSASTIVKYYILGLPLFDTANS